MPEGSLFGSTLTVYDILTGGIVETLTSENLISFHSYTYIVIHTTVITLTVDYIYDQFMISDTHATIQTSECP